MGTQAPGPATRLCDLALSEPVWLSNDATIQDVAQAMVRTGASAAMIGVGPAVVSERDVVRAVALGESGDAPAHAVAVPEAVTIERTAPAIEALATMLDHGIRHLVVVDAGGKPCGMVSLRAAAGAVFGQVDSPPWLSALRVALHVEQRIG
jgi:signal-transduction protein with cAMP-binding, CBS, and nucleotidyltransferase domain